MQKNRLEWIDSCRGVAIILVIIVHVGQIFSNTSINFISSFAKNGVQMFFILSGFTLFYSIDKQNRQSIRSFYIRRYFRIAPLYYISAIYYCVESINSINIKYLIINLLFLNQLYLLAFNYIPPGGWSIATEMMFYFFIPILYKKINSINNSIKYFITTLLLSIGINLAIYFIMKLIFNRTYYISDSLFINNLHVFLLGILLYYLIKQNKIHFNNICVFISALLLFIYLIKVPFSTNYNNIYKFPYSMINYTYSFSVVVFLLIIGIYNTNQKYYIMILFQRIGKLSFSIYLVHFAILSKLGFLLNKFNEANFLAFFA